MTAYLIATIDVHDAEGYKLYQTVAPALIESHGGRYIVRGGARDLVEGTWPEGRIVVLEFPDLASANAFANDPAYKPVAKIRHATTTSHVWIVEGLDGGGSAEGQHAYILGNIRMTDPNAYKSYSESVPNILAASGGIFLARGGAAHAIEGGMKLDRAVIVAFESMAACRAFYDGADYANIKPIRIAASDSNIVIAEGL